MGLIQTLRSTLREWFGGSPVDTFLYDDDESVRRYTAGGGRRDLSPMDQGRMLSVSRYLYDSHPLAAWMVDQHVALLLGDELGYAIELDAAALGYTPEQAAAVEKRIKVAIDRMWDGPAFSMRYRADELLTSALVDGELLLPIVSRNPTDGLPQFDMADASQIAKVHLRPGSGLLVDRVELKPKTPGEQGAMLRPVAFNPETQRLEGEAFFFRYSYIANQARGRSFLLRVSDWLDVLDQFLYARADRATLMNAMVWHVRLKNATQEQVDAKAADLRKNPPNKPGTVRVTNDLEEWDAKTPDLKAEDATAEVKLLRNYILGSKSKPESWFSDGGDATRTTAGEQNDVAFMALRRDRKMVRALFRTILHYAYDELHAAQPRLFPDRSTGAVKIEPDLPPLDEKDISRLGGVIQNLESALESAIGQRLISRKTARKVFLHMVDRMGVSVDPDDEKRSIEEEQETDALTIAARAQAAAASSAMGQPADTEDDAEDEPAA